MGLVGARTASPSNGPATNVPGPDLQGQIAFWLYPLQGSVPLFSAGADGDRASLLPLLETHTDRVDYLFATLEGDRLA